MKFISLFRRLIPIAICLLLIPDLSAATSSNLEVITPDNAASITEVLPLVRWYEGQRQAYIFPDVAWTDDSQTLAVSTRIGVMFYDMDDPENPIQMTANPVTALISPEFDPDRLFAARWGAGYVELWEIGSDTDATILSHSNALEFAFNRDGRLFATGGGDGTIMVWRTDTYEPIASPDTGYDNAILDLAFSPTEDLLVAVTLYEGVFLYYMDTGDDFSDITIQEYVLEQFNGGSGVISPNGSTLVVGFYDPGGTDDTIMIWDIESRTLTRTLPGHIEFTRTLVFSPDGRLLVSTGNDDIVRIWDFETGQEIISIPFDSGINDIAFSPDQRRIALLGFDYAIGIWGVPSP